MEIIRHTSLGKMVSCCSVQCNDSYPVSCSTAVLVILVVLIALLPPAVKTGVWGRGRLGGTRPSQKLVKCTQNLDIRVRMSRPDFMGAIRLKSKQANTTNLNISFCSVQ